MNKGILVLTIILVFATLCSAQVKTTIVRPKGVYTEIDVTRDKEAIEALSGKNKNTRQQIIDDILKRPNLYNPPVIYALSRELYNQNKKDDAAYWFYLAQLRARYDANLCMDSSAKQAVSILNNEYGPKINKYAFKDISKLENTVSNVVNFVRNNEELYDHRWINLYGINAILSGLDDDNKKQELSQPNEKWAVIKEKTIDDYYADFLEYIKK